MICLLMEIEIHGLHSVEYHGPPNFVPARLTNIGYLLDIVRLICCCNSELLNTINFMAEELMNPSFCVLQLLMTKYKHHLWGFDNCLLLSFQNYCESSGNNRVILVENVTPTICFCTRNCFVGKWGLYFPVICSYPPWLGWNINSMDKQLMLWDLLIHSV